MVIHATLMPCWPSPNCETPIFAINISTKHVYHVGLFSLCCDTRAQLTIPDHLFFIPDDQLGPHVALYST